MSKFVARKPEKEVISMRIATAMLKVVDDKAAQIGISRNELINQMIRYALDNMDDTQTSADMEDYLDNASNYGILVY